MRNVTLRAHTGALAIGPAADYEPAARTDIAKAMLIAMNTTFLVIRLKHPIIDVTTVLNAKVTVYV